VPRSKGAGLIAPRLFYCVRTESVLGGKQCLICYPEELLDGVSSSGYIEVPLKKTLTRRHTNNTRGGK
jgi:hypothetical protein